MTRPAEEANVVAGPTSHRLLRRWPPAAMVTRVREDSLLRNSLFIMATTVVNSALGYGFWLIAARRFAAPVVGLAAAIIAAITIVALLASLGVGATLIQSLPEPGRRVDRPLTLWTGIVTATGASLVIACVILVALPLISGEFAVLDAARYAAVFVIAAVAWTIAAVLDSVFVAERAAGNMLSRNTVTAGAKVLVIALLTIMAATGVLVILVAWTFAAVLGLAVGVGLLIRRVGALPRPTLRAMATRARGLRSRIVGNQLIGVGGALPPLILPLLVTVRLSAKEDAYFYTTWMVCGIFLIISPAVSASLFAEGAHSPRELRSKTRAALTIICALLVPCGAVYLIIGTTLLSTFGAAYEQHAIELLELVVLSAIPDAITNVYVSLLRVQGRLAKAAGLNLGMAVGTFALSWGLLPTLGITAVGWAWLAMQLTGCVVVAVDLGRGRLFVPVGDGEPVAAETR
jgi:O-antigen/teichoic acid export membrane protein